MDVLFFCINIYKLYLITLIFHISDLLGEKNIWFGMLCIQGMFKSLNQNIFNLLIYSKYSRHFCVYLSPFTLPVSLHLQMFWQKHYFYDSVWIKISIFSGLYAGFFFFLVFSLYFNTFVSYWGHLLGDHNDVIQILYIVCLMPFSCVLSLSLCVAIDRLLY